MSSTVSKSINQFTIEVQDRQRTRILRFFFKRLLDFLVAFFGLLILSPLFLVISMFIRRDSPGPVFFKCYRMGKDQRPFKMLKFRTMYERPSSYEGPRVTCNGDERITPFGRWLRDTKINELPQLWNVLIGEMSLVGPRPEDVEIAKTWPDEVRKEILSVRPGVTSPASILYHAEEKLLSKSTVMEQYFSEILPDKLRLDQLYVRNNSFTADLDIIFWTLAIFIPRISKVTIPEGLLFFGPISRLMHRYVNWFLLDLITSLFVVGIVGILWRLQMPLNWGINYLAAFAIILALLFSGVNSLAGMNRILWSRATINDGIGIIATSTVVTLLILALNYLESKIYILGIPPLPESMIVLIGLLAQIGFLVNRFRLRVLSALASFWMSLRRNSLSVGERVLIVGLGEGFDNVVAQLRRGAYRHIFSIVGVVEDNNPALDHMYVNQCLVLGRVADIPELVEKQDIGVVIFTEADIDPEIKTRICALSQASNLRIAFVNEATDILGKQIAQPARTPSQYLWSEDHVNYLITHDTVTGLPNNFLFSEQLRHSLAYSVRHRTNTAVMFISMNGSAKNFQELGQKVTSELLRQVAERLLREKRETDTLAYLDHDEFGLILENVQGDDVLLSIAKRIHKLLSGVFIVDNNQFALTPKISVKTDFHNGRPHNKFNPDEIKLFINQARPISYHSE